MKPAEVLVVALDDAGAEVISGALKVALREGHRISRVSSAEEAEVWLDWNVADMVVTSLAFLERAPRAQLERLRELARETPLIAATTVEGERLVERHLERIDDYLCVDRLREVDLRRLAGYAHQRAGNQRLHELQAEIAHYRACLGPKQEAVITPTPLRERQNEAFLDLVERHVELVGAYLEYLVAGRSKPSEQICRELDQLANLQARSADLTEAHSMAIDRLIRERGSQRGQALIVESRQLLLELLGELADRYRTTALHDADS